MITYVSGDLFESPAHVLVNTVNTVGVMGKGVALQFKKLFPEMFTRYRHLCETRRFTVGNLLLYKTPHKWVLNFPTKMHWRNPSRPEYIQAGLQKLTEIYLEAGIYELAMPLLGCGNGELDWKSQVQPLVEKYLKKLPIDVFIHFYPPGSLERPEHRNIAEMEKWLRSEPEDLAFEEVWCDLKDVLAKSRTFKTLATRRSEFGAEVSDERRGIKITTNSRAISISTSELLDFWQQLRKYGFTSSQIAPSGLSRSAYYLMPIFAELAYVKPARMSDSFDRFSEGQDTTGLQYVPRLASAKSPLLDTSISL